MKGLESMNEFMTLFESLTWTCIDGLITLLTLLLVILNWCQNHKQNKQIEIFINFKDDGEIIKLPIRLIRKNFTRAEIFGVLGAFDKDSKFTIAHTSTVVFFEDIEQIQKGKKNEICITITENDKFDRVNI